MIVEDFKKSILNYAICGKLSIQNKNESVKGVKEIDNADNLFEIPKNWIWTKLKYVGKLVRGNGIKRTETVNEGFPCIRYGEIYTSYSYSFKETISFIEETNSKKYKSVNYGDVLFTLTGENEYDIAKATAYLGNKGLVMGGDMCSLTEHNQNPMYIVYCMFSQFLIKQKSKTAKGNIIVHTSTDKIGEYIIPLPPLEEQQRIVDKIEEIFAKLNEIKPIEEELKFLKDSFPNDMITSILNDAYTGKLTNQNTSVWNSNKLIDCCKDIVTGNSISESIKKSKYTNIKDGYNYIATKDLEFNHTFNYDNGIKIPFDEKGFKYARENDILICIEGGSAGKKIGILNETVCYGNKLCRFSTNPNILPKFLYYYLQSPIFLKNFNSNLSGIIGGVSINKIKNIELKYPSIEDQQIIVNKIEQLLPLCNDIGKLISE